jgi:hypothetical protein
MLFFRQPLRRPAFLGGIIRGALRYWAGLAGV